MVDREQNYCWFYLNFFAFTPKKQNIEGRCYPLLSIIREAKLHAWRKGNPWPLNPYEVIIGIFFFKLGIRINSNIG